MRFRMASVNGLVAAALAATLLTAGARTAHAQAALDDDESSKPAATTGESGSGEETRVGVGFRIRQTWVPKSIIELFIAKAAGGGSSTGFGFEVVRRTGNFEVQ